MNPANHFEINPFEVHVSNENYNKIRFLISIAPEEVEWYMTTSRIEYGHYRISKILLMPQGVSMIHAEAGPKEMIALSDEIESRCETDEEYNDIMGNMFCLWHSHHNMGVNPSSTDYKTFNKLCRIARRQPPEYKLPVVLSFIGNK